MITTTPPSRDVKSRKRKREVEGLSSPSADAVSEKKIERDGAHGSGAVQDCGPQEQCSVQKTTRSGEGNGGFHQLDI